MGAVVGSDVERYVRALTIAGLVGPVLWGTRPFGPEDVSAFLRDTSVGLHPWRSRIRAQRETPLAAGASGFVSANSAFPWGANDGALWQGRGLTIAAGTAAVLRWGRIEAVAAPVLYSAQNQSFPLMPQPVETVSPFADGQYSTGVDLPQRMGSRTQTRLDAGESTVRMRFGAIVMGASTASLGWGAAESFSTLFGSNAGGFPHLFVGFPGRGLLLKGIGRVGARYVLGELQQSAWSPVQGSESFVDAQQTGTRRVGSGLVVSFAPAFLPNLELGANRFYHSPYATGIFQRGSWSKPFEGIFKRSFVGRVGGAGDPGGDTDNQLASAFARWSFPERGVEATFELYREDHSWDWRDQAQEPENNGALSASIQAVTSRSATQLSTLTFEYFDGDIKPIAQARGQGALYINFGVRQGHTQRGQLLGSPIGVGAIAGQRVAWERFTPRGALRFHLQRWRNRAIRSTLGEGFYLGATEPVPNSHDWIVDANVASTRYRGSKTISLESGVAYAGRWQLNTSRTNFYARASWIGF